MNFVTKLKLFLNNLPWLGLKYRIAYDFKSKQTYIINVAKKNMIKSLQGSLLLIHSILLSGANIDPQIMVGALALEQEQLFTPAILGVFAYQGGLYKWNNTEEETRQLLAMTLGTAAFSASKYFVDIPKQIPSFFYGNDQIITYEKDILIPLDLQKRTTERGEVLWTGILWSPVYGVKHFFDGRNQNETLQRQPETFLKSYFVIRREGNGSLTMIFSNFDGTRQIMYRYKPSVMLYHIWFVKENSTL